MIDNLLFDLDGTLTRPDRGIVNCLLYAIEKLERSVPSRTVLENTIGQPLREAFGSLLETDDLQLIESAISFYRSRFAEEGFRENELMAGAESLLASLHAEGRKLFICTSKARPLAEKVIDHFGFTPYFSGVYGPELGGKFDDKSELVAHILEVHGLEAENTAIIGDRKYDILAGEANGLKTFGVLCGFGERQELIAAGASRIFDTLFDLNSFFQEGLLENGL